MFEVFFFHSLRICWLIRDKIHNFISPRNPKYKEAPDGVVLLLLKWYRSGRERLWLLKVFKLEAIVYYVSLWFPAARPFFPQTVSA